FLLGHGANLLDVPLDTRGDEVAVSAHPALQIDKMVVVTDAPDTRLDLCTLLGQALMFTAGRFERLPGVARTALVWLGTHTVQRRLHLIERRLRLDGRLVGGPLFG